MFTNENKQKSKHLCHDNDFSIYRLVNVLFSLSPFRYL